MWIHTGGVSESGGVPIYRRCGEFIGELISNIAIMAFDLAKAYEHSERSPVFDFTLDRFMDVNVEVVFE
jgi:hypothetical protein